MTLVLSLAGLAFAAAGVAFLLLAALGLWRLPDTLSRLHALTKADTAGLSLVAVGAACLSNPIEARLSLLLCVVLVAVSGATIGHLIARAHQEHEAE